DAEYWDERYKHQETGWDIGHISPPLKAYFDQVTNKDLNILIPGCGMAHEASYLSQMGFKSVTVIDLSETVINSTKARIGASNIHFLVGDFFELKGQFDLIVEQTFFCALNPNLRTKYVEQMLNLLPSQGKLIGLLFASHFDKPGPPFGGNKTEYLQLFEKQFDVKTMEIA